jgi:hypothetical protein
MIDVSIIIVNFNTHELTCNCIKSVISRAADINYEIIIVDNASTDDSTEKIKNQFTNVKLIENIENIGFGRANNVGIRTSESKYVFLLNSDTILVNNAIKMFFEFMEQVKNQEVACCGGQLYSHDMSKQLSYCDLPSIKDVAIRCFINPYEVLKRIFNISEFPIFSTNNDAQKVGFISGADMFIRREVLKEVGLFDEDFFLYFEETELSYRFKKYGYKSMFLPNAKIKHLCGASINNNKDLDRMKLFRQSELLYFKKCYGLLAAYLVKLIYVFSGIINGLFKGDGNYLRSAWLISKLKI